MSSMAIAAITPQQNQLLAALPPEVWDRLREHLDLRSMPLGHVLHEPDTRQQHAYFPTSSLISLVHTLADGCSAEIAIVGREGVVGLALCMGGETSPRRAVVQSAGHAYRLHGRYLREEFSRGGALQHLMLRYTQALITQMAQTAVCNRHHTVEQQLCRWLLMSMDRLGSNELVMTQELIANMLGVRREGVTEAAGKLQRLGMISYHRGHIAVLDRPALQALVCECYQVVKTEYERLLPRATGPLPGGAESKNRSNSPRMSARPSGGASKTYPLTPGPPGPA